MSARAEAQDADAERRPGCFSRATLLSPTRLRAFARIYIVTREHDALHAYDSRSFSRTWPSVLSVARWPSSAFVETVSLNLHTATSRGHGSIRSTKTSTSPLCCPECPRPRIPRSRMRRARPHHTSCHIRHSGPRHRRPRCTCRTPRVADGTRRKAAHHQAVVRSERGWSEYTVT